MDKWGIAQVIKLRKNRITQAQVAKKLGTSSAYVSMILNGYKPAENCRKRIEAAIDELIAEKEAC